MYGELPKIKTSDGAEVAGYPVQIINPPKTAVLRLPTNDELLVYLAAQRSIIRNRATGAEDVPTPKSDETLFRALRLDNGDDFDDAETAYALGLLLRVRTTDCERDGQTYKITLSTPFGEVVHVVEIPTQKDMAEYRRNVIKSKQVRGGEEMRFPPEVPIKLYDKVIRVASGYVVKSADAVEALKVTVQLAVPPHHKRAVVMELLTSLSDLDASFDPNS